MGRGSDLIMDATGPTNFRKDYRLLRQGGRLVMYGMSEANTGTGRSIPRLLRSLARGCRWPRCRGGRAFS